MASGGGIMGGSMTTGGEVAASPGWSGGGIGGLDYSKGDRPLDAEPPGVRIC